MSTHKRIVRNFEDFHQEAKMMSDLSGQPIFHVDSPIEQYFMDVADKHGVLDEMIFMEDDEGW